MQTEDLLFTDNEGTRTQLQDVIYDGLDNDYSARYPALVRLMQEGDPAYRLYSCVMLASWGVPEGLRTLIEWARDPGSTPWATEPVTYDRFYGVDSAFVMLAEAVRTAGENERNGEIDTLRLEAMRALLRIHDRVYFERSLVLALDLDRPLAASVRSEIAVAVDRAVAASRTGEMPFDMATQAAFLLGALAPLDDAHAASAAEALLAAPSARVRTIREVAYALGAGTGQGTRAVLERLAAYPVESVRKDAQDSLSRRKATSQQ